MFVPDGLPGVEVPLLGTGEDGGDGSFWLGLMSGKSGKELDVGEFVVC